MRRADPSPPASAPMVPAIHRVVARRQDLPDTVTITLEAPVRGGSVPAAGQFNMLWAFGVGEAPISLAGLDDGDVVHTIRSVGAVTAALCALDVGDEVGVRGPYGVGWDLDRAVGRDVLVIAGGLGLAPVRPIVTELLRRREEFGRVALLVGARSPDQLLYPDEIESWADGDLDVRVTVDSAPPSWTGEVGVVTSLIGRVAVDPQVTTAYVCGPEIMMRFCAPPLIERGVDPAELFLSLERNMHCAIGHCGHCQLGPHFVCTDGPVLPWTALAPSIRIRER